MADEWFENHITKELDNAKKDIGNIDTRMQLQEIIKEGFINTGKTAGYLHIYEKIESKVINSPHDRDIRHKDNIEVIFYDKYKDRIAARFDLNDLMTKI